MDPEARGDRVARSGGARAGAVGPGLVRLRDPGLGAAREWLGHAVHPPLTDVALGTWTSASLLDLMGGPQSYAAAQRLVGVGLLAAGPTAWTGWSEWSAAGPRDKRVGVVHAVVNGAAIGVYAASWMARRGGRHGTGAGLALAGAALTGVAAYLGGHLTEARKVATHHPAYDDAAQVLRAGAPS